MEFGVGFVDETHKMREAFEQHLQGAYPGCRVILWSNGLIPAPGTCCAKIQLQNGTLLVDSIDGSSYKDALNTLINKYNDAVHVGE